MFFYIMIPSCEYCLCYSLSTLTLQFTQSISANDIWYSHQFALLTMQNFILKWQL